MSKDPAFLFYPNDYLGGTMGMTFEMKGAYIDLLIFQFNNHQFTESQAKQVLSICFSSVWEVLKNKFKKDGEFYFNERLREEIDKRKAFSESRRINALHDKKPRKSKPKAYAKHMGNENENENKDKTKDKTKDKVLHLDVVLLTDIEYQKLITKYGKQSTEKAIEILNNAIMSKGYKYKSHYHTIIGWPMKEAQGGNNGTGNATFTRKIRTERDAINEAACDEADRIARDYYAKHASTDGNT
jgi:uncharacterized protein YdaU (DUF1376 family)